MKVSATSPMQSNLQENSPSIRIRAHSIRTRQVCQILCIPRRVSCNRNILRRASSLMIRWNAQPSQHLRRLNNCSRKPHNNMPLDMAMEQPDSRIISHETDYCIRARVHSNGISLHRHGWEIPTVADILPFSRHRLLANLELMAVQMEWVNRSIEVVYGELHDGTPFGDERVHVPIDGGIGV